MAERSPSQRRRSSSSSSRRSTSGEEDEQDLRAQMLDLLLSKIEEDTYPSTTHLDLVEELLTPDDVPRYAQLLMSKISEENYPSLDMLDRVRSLT